MARPSPGRARTATVRRFTNAELKAEVDRAAAMFARLGVKRRRPRGHLPAAAARDGHIRVGAWQAEGDLHPDLLRLRGAGGSEQAQRRRCHLACHGRRHASPRRQSRPEAHRGRRSRTGADASSTCSSSGALAASAPQAGWVEGRDRWWSTEMADPTLQPLTETPGHGPRNALHDHLHVGHHRPAQGRRPRPRRLPDQGRAGPRPLLRPGPGDRLFWFTDLGWMMGPWAISGALLLGAELVLYEGAPDYPAPDRLWAAGRPPRRDPPGPLAHRHPRAHGPRHATRSRGHDLIELRVLGSTGEPWNPESWWWFFNNVGGGRLPLINYSGGTEVSGGIVSCNLLTPIKPTSFGGPNVGTAADVIDAAGNRRPRRGRRAGHPPAAAGHDARLLERSASATSRRTGRASRARGCTATGRSSTRTATGSSRAAATTRSRSPASASGRRRSRAPRSPTRPCSRPRPSACRTRSRARSSSSSSGSGRGEVDDPELRRSISDKVVEQMGKALQARGRLRRQRSAAHAQSARSCAASRARRYLGSDPGDLSALENPAAVESIRAAGAGSG